MSGRASRALVLVLSLAGLAPASPAPDGIWGTRCVADATEARDAAALAATRMGERADRMVERLGHLLATPGPDLYLSIDRPRPFRVRVEPGPRAHMRIEAGRVDGALWAYPGGSACGGEGVFIFWVKGTAQPEYVLQVPPPLARLTVVAGGETVLDARSVHDLREPFHLSVGGG